MMAARQFGIVLLLLASYLTPAMACAVSSVPMNSAERVCCRAMKSQCEQMGMSTSHGCCQKTPKSAQDSALATESLTYHPTAVAVVWITAAEWLNLNGNVTGWIERTADSPPQSPPTLISVLRI